MQNRTKIAIGIAAIAVAGAVPLSGIAGAASGETDQPITGEALDRATEAALTHVGEGQVTETEIGDEESFYEVEVTRDDGTEVDVQLDGDFAVVGVEEDGLDDDDSSGGEGPDDDSSEGDGRGDD